MIKPGILAAGLLLAPALISPPAVRAQSINSPFDFVEGSQGLYAFGTAIFTDRGAVDTGPGSGYAAGLGYNLKISGPFNLEARATYFPTDRRVYTDNSTLADSAALRADPMTGLEQIGTADLSLLLLDATLRFNVTGPRTWYHMQPYLMLGVGGALATSSDNAAEADLPPDLQLQVRFRNGFTGHLGAGVEVHLSDRLTVRADARDLLWKLHLPLDFLTTGRVIDDQQWVQTAQLSLGLGFRF